MGGIFGNSDDDDDDPRIVDWERFETSVRSFLELLFSPEWKRYCSKKTFTIEIRLAATDGRKEFRARASGSTKKAAEQNAARKALEKLAPASNQ